MTIDLYYCLDSPPCRSILMAAKILGVELNLKFVNLTAGEHLTPEFLKMNPQHFVPTLVDDGFVLWESRAILVYLAEKYGKDDSLYPKCPKKKAVINQRLYFDALTLYASFGDLYYPHMFEGAPLDEEKSKKLTTAIELLETFLTGNKYVAGDSLSLADLAVVASVTTIQAVGIDLSKYANISQWLASVIKEIPEYDDANGKGAEEFRQLFVDVTSKK